MIEFFKIEDYNLRYYMVEDGKRRPGENNDGLNDKYSSRYLEAERMRDETLERMNTVVPERVRHQFQEFIEIRRKGINVSDPKFVDRNRDTIIATLPMFRIALRRMHVHSMFTQLLDGVNPRNRTTTSIPIPNDQALVVSGFGSDELGLVDMYSGADNQALHAEINNFNILEAVSAFLTSLEDTTPLLPVLPPTIASEMGSMRRERGIIAVRAKTRLMGVDVVYHPYETPAANIPSTQLFIKPLR